MLHLYAKSTILEKLRRQYSDNRWHTLMWAFLFLCSISLIASSIYRAKTFPFTHDESLSFTIFTGYPDTFAHDEIPNSALIKWDPSWGKTANNHRLNTLLMQFCSMLFGNSELSLRLPNVMAHLIYLIATILLIKRFQHSILVISGFIILNLNPFLLDFFFLARGYGLALAFMMLSLFFLSRAYDEKRKKTYFINSLFLSVLTSSYAVLANFAFLNYHLPLLLASSWLLFSDSSLRSFRDSQIRPAIALLSMSMIFLLLIFPDVFELRRRGELYFGGHSGFIPDTVNSLLHASLYYASLSQLAEGYISTMLVALFVLLIFLGLYVFVVKKDTPLFALFFLIMVSSVALPIIQHLLFHTLFPIERSALYYLPLGGVVILTAFELLMKLSHNRLGKLVILFIPTAIALVLCCNFIWNFDTRLCYTWGYDRHNIDILEIIDRDRINNFQGRTIALGNSWPMEPSLNYYRITRKYTWLDPLTEKPIIGTCYNYIYAFESEVNKQLEEHSTMLASYHDIHTVLLRIDSPQCLKGSSMGNTEISNIRLNPTSCHHCEQTKAISPLINHELDIAAS